MHQWPRARVGESKQQAEQREHPRPTAKTTREKKRGKPGKHNEKEGAGVATTGGGAGKAEEDRTEEAAHITLE